MIIEEVMKLVNAGFTKDEILAMSGSTPTPTETVTEDKAVETDVTTPIVEDKAEENKETEKTVESTPQTTNVNFAPMMTDAQIEKLAQMLNRGSATIDLPQKKNVEDVLGEHFKDLMLGKE